jgi:hypothetical protein
VGEDTRLVSVGFSHVASLLIFGLQRDFELLYDIVDAVENTEAKREFFNAVLELLGKAPGPESEAGEWLHVWPVLLDGLVEAGHEVVVFTTNYDPLLEHVREHLERQAAHHAARLYTGVEPGSPPGATSGYRFAFPLRAVERAYAWGGGGPSAVPVVYLHGCLAWRKYEEPGEYCVQLRFREGQAVTTQPDQGILRPGRGKMPTQTPFREAYWALAKAAASAEVLLLIGTSLRDPALWASLLMPAALGRQPRLVSVGLGSDDGALRKNVPKELEERLEAYPWAFCEHTIRSIVDLIR